MSVSNPTRRASLRDVSPGRLGCPPGTSRSVIDDLLGVPAPSQESRALRSLDALVAVTTVGLHVADEIESALSELATLAPFTAKAVAS